MKQNRDYIPALHFDWLTPWYDLFIGRLYPEARLKQSLIDQADIQLSHKVLDIGCGTATLTLRIKQTQPAAQVYGLDVDTKILDIARNKARQTGADIILDLGTATRLPYPDQSFNHVFASLMLHHLVREDKQRMLGEAFRILKPDGELHVADFGAPHNRRMFLISLVIRWLEETSDAIHGLLPKFMEEAGFNPVEETACYATIFGTIRLYRARRPSGKAGELS